MCIRVSRICPGCSQEATAYNDEVDACDEAPQCPNTTTFTLPLRREQAIEYRCLSVECPYNHQYTRGLERQVLRARLAQREGDMAALAPHLNVDGTLIRHPLPIYIKKRALTHS